MLFHQTPCAHAKHQASSLTNHGWSYTKHETQAVQDATFLAFPPFYDGLPNLMAYSSHDYAPSEILHPPPYSSR